MITDSKYVLGAYSAVLAMLLFIGIVIFGSMIWMLWQQLHVFLWIVWGTGGRAITTSFDASLNSYSELFPHYFFFSLRYLVVGAIVHCVVFAIWMRSILALCIVIALFSSIPELWNLVNLLSAGQVGGVGGKLAVFAWVASGVLRWIFIWVLIWYQTNALIRWRTR